MHSRINSLQRKYMAKYTKVNIIEDLLLQEVFASTNKRQVTEFVDDFFQLITDKIASGDEVTIAKFGRFEKYVRENGTKKPKFTPYLSFKLAVND